MSAPARSLAVWSVYALSVGLLLLVVPNFLLGLFQIEETSESWVRVLGSTVILLAIYYVYIVRENSVSMFRATVLGRGLVAIVLTVLAFSTGPWQLVLFAIADALGTAWTQFSLRNFTPVPLRL